MDINPRSWILEYLLRQPLEDSLLKILVDALSPLQQCPNLKKSLLLQKLNSEASQRSITENTLELLESLMDIELRRRGNAAVSDAMKNAYCAVAVECTLKELQESDADDKDAADFKFFETVKRLWRGRIQRMKAAEGEGMGSEELWTWGKEIEAAVWNDNARKLIMENYEDVQAAEAVGVYVREERERMGPTFLEVVVEKMKDNAALTRIMGVEGMMIGGEETPTCNGELEETPATGDDRAVSGSLGETHVDGAVTVTGCSDGEELEETPPRETRVDGAVTGSSSSEKLEETPACGDDRAGSGTLEATRVDGPATGNVRAEKRKGKEIVDEATPKPKYRKLPTTILVNKARATLLSSMMELRALVKDPLPEALRAAEEFGDAIATPNVMHQQNSASYNHELDDSEDIACWAVPQSPKRIHTSPLKPYKFDTIKQRRKARKWSSEEEGRLRMRVKQFGIGHWKEILQHHPDDFIGRTEVDLKDKWRNLMRYGECV